jgi:hypothetical protein
MRNIPWRARVRPALSHEVRKEALLLNFRVDSSLHESRQHKRTQERSTNGTDGSSQLAGQAQERRSKQNKAIEPASVRAAFCVPYPSGSGLEVGSAVLTGTSS